MTVYKPIEQEASTAAILAVALGNGTDITSKDCEIPVTETTDDGSGEIPYYKITPIAVTAENMDEVIVDGGFHSKEDVYLNVKKNKRDVIRKGTSYSALEQAVRGYLFEGFDLDDRQKVTARSLPYRNYRYRD